MCCKAHHLFLFLLLEERPGAVAAATAVALAAAALARSTRPGPARVFLFCLALVAVASLQFTDAQVKTIRLSHLSLGQCLGLPFPPCPPTFLLFSVVPISFYFIPS